MRTEGIINNTNLSCLLHSDLISMSQSPASRFYIKLLRWLHTAVAETQWWEKVRWLGSESHCKQVPHITRLRFAQRWTARPDVGSHQQAWNCTWQGWKVYVCSPPRGPWIWWLSHISQCRVIPQTSPLRSRPAGTAPEHYCQWIFRILQGSSLKMNLIIS